MNKSTFDNRPMLLEQEGTVMRINFDVESVEQEFPSMDGGEPVAREVFLAHVVRVAIPLSAESVRSALMTAGFDDLKSEAVAREVMFVSGGSSNVELAKAMVIARIKAYDSSDAVNQFTYNGLSMWLNDAMRTKLSKRFDTDEQDGKDVTRVTYEGVSFDLPIATARVMLHQIESYATACFDKTNDHIAAVNALTTVEKVEAYDYTQGYPPKINFDTMSAD